MRAETSMSYQDLRAAAGMENPTLLSAAAWLPPGRREHVLTLSAFYWAVTEASQRHQLDTWRIWLLSSERREHTPLHAALSKTIHALRLSVDPFFTVLDGVEEQLSPTAVPDLELIYGQMGAALGELIGRTLVPAESHLLPYARLLGEAVLLTDLICGPRRHRASRDLLDRLAGRYSAALKGIRHLPVLSRPFVRSLVVLYRLRLERMREKWDSSAALPIVLPERERRWQGAAAALCLRHHDYFCVCPKS